MIGHDVVRIVRELGTAGFELAACERRSLNGPHRFHLSGRGPYGAFVVSARTETEAYRAALDQARSHLVPVRLAWRDRR